MKSRHFSPLNEAEQRLIGDMYEQHRGTMYAAAFSYLHNEADAEDVVQEVFLNLAGKHMSTVIRLSEEGTLLYYLLTSVRNTALNHLKKAGTRRESPVDLNALSEAVLSDDSFADALSDSMEVDSLVRIINSMKPKYRDVLIQRFVLELSVREIAESSGSPVVTIKKRLQKAKQMLWKLCREEGHE